MQFADEAYDILGFTKEEKYDVYKVIRVLKQVLTNLTPGCTQYRKTRKVKISPLSPLF